MTAVQMGLTIAVCTAATMLTRFLPFLIFSSKEQQPPEVVRYLGRVLPPAVIAMLIMMVFVLVYLRIYNKSSEKVG